MQLAIILFTHKFLRFLFVNTYKMRPDHGGNRHIFTRKKQRDGSGGLFRHMTVYTIFFQPGNQCGIHLAKIVMFF